jgi:hypothetical protein
MCPESFRVTSFPKVAAKILKITHGLDYIPVAFSMIENTVYNIKKSLKFVKEYLSVNAIFVEKIMFRINKACPPSKINSNHKIVTNLLLFLTCINFGSAIKYGSVICVQLSM